MKNSCASISSRIFHLVTIVLLFIASCDYVVQADMFHYWHLKKILKAYAVAKALGGKKLTLIPIPIPIPIPIHQNEVIRIPISGGGHSDGVKTVVLSGSGSNNHNKYSSGIGGFLNGGSYGSSTYGYGYQGFGQNKGSKKFYGLSDLSNLYNQGIKVVDAADPFGGGGGDSNSISTVGDGHYGHGFSGHSDMEYQQSSPYPSKIMFGNRKRRLRFFPGLRRNHKNQKTVIIYNGDGNQEFAGDSGFSSFHPQQHSQMQIPAMSSLPPMIPPSINNNNEGLPVGDSWKPPMRRLR